MLTEITRRKASPAFERPGEVAGVAQAEEEGDFRDRARGLTYVATRKLLARLIQQLLETSTAL